MESEHEVLRAATVNAAQVLGVQETLGSIEVGKVADLVLLETNPLLSLDVLKRPQAVVKEGQWLDRNTLLNMRGEAQNTVGFYRSMGQYLETVVVRLFQ